MPKVKETNKHCKLDAVSVLQKHSREPYSRSRNFESLFRDFSKTHKSELKSTKAQIKHLSEEVIKSQKLILEKTETIKSLKTKIDGDEQEIKKFNADKDKISTEYKTLKQHFDELENKYATLENSYDTNVAEMRRIIEQYKEFCANHQELSNKFTEQSQKFLAAKKQLQEAQQNVEKTKEDITEIQTDFEAYKHKVTEEKENARKEYETNMDTLKAEMQDQENRISKCEREKIELETAKNVKIIEKQAYKMREIERVFDQPMNRVTPTASDRPVKLSPTHNVAPLQIDNQEVTTAKSNIALLPAANADRGVAACTAWRAGQQSKQQQSIETSTATWVRQTLSYAPTATELSSDDESLNDLLGWHPVFPKNSNASEELPQRASVARKRLVPEDDGYIPETSGSDRFDFKRKKK